MPDWTEVANGITRVALFYFIGAKFGEWYYRDVPQCQGLERARLLLDEMESWWNAPDGDTFTVSRAWLNDMRHALLQAAGTQETVDTDTSKVVR